MDRVAVVGMDLHRDFSKAVVMAEDGKILETRSVYHDGHEEMAEFFGGFEPGTEVVMEAGFNWPWIADMAEKAGLKPHLGHALRCREMAKGMAKNDKKDATFLARLWLAGDIFPEAYLAPREVRARRARFRTRALLVKIKAELKNSIHGILIKNGVKREGISDLYGRKGRQWLAGLGLSPEAREEMETKLAVADDVDRHISGLEQKLWAELPTDPRASLLQTIPGIGRLIAYGLLAEIGEIGRFPDRRALASYAGLLPMDNESAGEEHGKRTSRRCAKFLKLMAIEAVRGAVKTSRRMRQLFERVRAKNPDKPGKAMVAVARELMEVVHIVLSRGVPYEEAPVRPGSMKGTATGHSEDMRMRNPHRASQIRCSAGFARSQAAT
jgi:transposase